MKKMTIIDELYKIAKENNVKILFASEVGSRAYGFPLPDSDFDVKFIYVKDEREYLKIKRDPKDTIVTERVLTGTKVDFAGWEITKFLNLLYDGNYSTFEWLSSPYIYIEDGEFRRMIGNIDRFLIPYRTILSYHKHALAGWQRVRILNDEVPIKSYLHIIDAILNAKGCASTKALPVLNIKQKLYRINNDDILKLVLKLIDERVEGKVTTTRNTELDFYIQTSLSHLEAVVLKWDGKRDSIMKFNIMDDILYQIIKEKSNE